MHTNPPLSSNPTGTSSSSLSSSTNSICPISMSIDERGSISIHCNIQSNEKYDVPPLRSLCCSPQTKEKICGDKSVTCGQRWFTVFKTAFFSWYFWASVVYVVYASQILAIDYCPYGSDDILCSFVGDTSINRQYVAAGAVHVTNAVQYAIAWNRDFHYPLTNLVIIPEILNLVEASLYLSTATKYANASEVCEQLTAEALANCTITDDDTSLCISNICDEIYAPIHKTELAASIVELLASIGWLWSFYQTYIRVPGRGFTLDDPDLIGSLFTFIPSIIYLVYYIQINLDPSQYGTNYLYVQGDILYMVGALGYFLGAWRDAGGTFFMPLAGGYDYKLIGQTKKFQDSHNTMMDSSVDNSSMTTGPNGIILIPNNYYPNDNTIDHNNAAAVNGTFKHSAIRDIVISTPTRSTNNTTTNMVPNPTFQNPSHSSTPVGIAYRNRVQPPNLSN